MCATAVAEVNGVDELKLHKPEEDGGEGEHEQAEQVEGEQSPEPNNDPDPIVEGEPVPEELGGEASIEPATEPTPIAEADAQFIAALREKEMSISRKAMLVEEIKGDLKEAKDELEAEISELRMMVRQGPNRQQTLPFKDDQGNVPEPAGTNEAATAAAPVDEVEDESWKGTPLTELQIPSKLLDHLAEAKLTTLGELAAYSATGAAFDLLDGIGPKSAERIEEATAKFWADRKQPASV